MRIRLVRQYLVAVSALFAGTTVAHAQTGPAAFLPEGAPADAPFGYTEMCARDPALCRTAPPRELARPADAQRAEKSVSLIIACTSPTPQVLRSAAIEHEGAWGFWPALGFGAGIGPVGGWQPATLEGPICREEPVDNDLEADTQPEPNPETARPTMTEGQRRQAIRAVNLDVNRHVIQATDYSFLGREEVWQRPVPNGRTMVGDCEDIAIEKRFRLIDAGFDPERLFYAAVFRRGFGLHTVLVVRMDDGDWVLDSLTHRLLRWNETGYTWLRREVPGRPDQWQTIGRAAPVQVATAGAGPAALAR